MKKIDSEELKVVQLHVMQAVHQFCEEAGITYSLACGTLLGAVRHKGYIPWDDDIDIYLERKEYERFIYEFPNEYKHVRLISLERDNSWDRAYAKAYDARTCFHEQTTLKENIGVNIDVYPIDQIPDDEIAWTSYNKKRRFIQSLYSLKVMQFNRQRGLRKNLIWVMAKILMLPFSARHLASFISKYAQRHNGNGYHRSFETVQGMLQKHPFDTELLKCTVQISFEGYMFQAMKEYDKYLSNAYGDYMCLPPEEKRISHHAFEAYWRDL